MHRFHTEQRGSHPITCPRPFLLLSELGENVCPSSGQPGPGSAELGPAQAHSFPPRSSQGLQGLRESQPKLQGLLNTKGTKPNTWPQAPSPAKQFRNKPPRKPLLQIFKSPTEEAQTLALSSVRHPNVSPPPDPRMP